MLFLPSSSSRSLSPLEKFLEPYFPHEAFPESPSTTSSWWAATTDTMVSRTRHLCRRISGRRGPLSILQILKLALCFALLSIALFVGYQNNILWNSGSRAISSVRSEPPWLLFDKMSGYYNGLRVLVPSSQHVPEYPPPNRSLDPTTNPPAQPMTSSMHVPLIEYNPYPLYNSANYLSKHHPVETCYMNPERTVPPPSIYAYDGIPQFQAEPVFGSYQVLGLRDDACFDRFGRLGPYNFEYDTAEEGQPKNNLYPPCEGNEAVCLQTSRIGHWLHNSRGSMNWSQAQNSCFDSNKQRFRLPKVTQNSDVQLIKTLPRNALVLRCWVGYSWNEAAILNLRALITELALNSGAEYTVHILLHLKDNSVPIWADTTIYRQVVEENIPREFWELTTLWTERYMEIIYSRPFGPSFEEPPSAGAIHGAYRSLHMPLQWFAHEHPEYEFFWNWEMDIRYTGHYYELLSSLDTWSLNEPREGIWERAAKYYIPALHGTWEEFSSLVHNETLPFKTPLPHNAKQTYPGAPPIFPGRTYLPQDPEITPPNCFSTAGADNSKCGIGEQADLITFNPLFDPEKSGWVLRDDIIGYDKSLPIPPRRTAIITASRLSRKLLTLMHDEMIKFGHAAFSEMWPPTTAFHHGLKALYAPHPVYFERKWPLEEVEKRFNGGKGGSSGGAPESPFNNANEHNFKGATWYYNAEFGNRLWRRWLGFMVDGAGGKAEEEGKRMGRMCLRSVMIHPVKPEMEVE